MHKSCETPLKRVCYFDFPGVCELGNYLFNTVKFFFKTNGYLTINTAAEADVIVIQTCTHLQHLKQSCRAGMDQVLGHPIAARPGKIILLLGCLSVRPDEYKSIGRLICLGPKDLLALNDIFQPTSRIEQLGVMGINTYRINTYQEYIQNNAGVYILISQGCAGHCTYCITPKVKGGLESRPIPDILAEIGEGVTAGAKQFTLLADDCGCYGIDRGTDIITLLSRIFDRYPDISLNFIYFEPSFLVTYFDRMKEFFTGHRIGYINIPIQSTSNRILKLMGRRYNIEEVFSKVGEIRELAPSVWIMSHLIFGFPTETETDFLGMMDVHHYFNEVTFVMYSEQEGIPSLRITPKVSREVSLHRAEILGGYLKRHNLRGMVSVE